ncbi:MAG: helix-turn-helix transcriptional regulator [Hyphomicrobiaceae bacterium]
MPAQLTKAHLARLLSRVVRCDRCVVYDIGEDLMPFGHMPHDGETRWVRPYENVASIDPMRPELHVKSASSLIVTGWNYPDDRLYRSAYYEGFMRPCGQRHKAELFFRNHSGRLIGGARLARRPEAGAFTGREVALLQLLQPVMESHINWAAMLGVEDRTGPFARLSAREWEVVRLAAAGLPNKVIGGRHGTSLPTVKSQLASAFRKLSVRSRAELMALFFAARDRHH